MQTEHIELLQGRLEGEEQDVHPARCQLKEPSASHAHTHACTQIKSTLAKRDLLIKQELATQITPDKWIKYNDLPVIKFLMSIKSNCFLNQSIHPIQI